MEKSSLIANTSYLHPRRYLESTCFIASAETFAAGKSSVIENTRELHPKNFLGKCMPAYTMKFFKLFSCHDFISLF